MRRNSQCAMNRRTLVWILCLVASPIFPTTSGLAQGPPPPEVRYTLLKGSYLNVSCPNCGPPPPLPPAAMSGTFTLRALESSDPLVNRYQLTNVYFAGEGYWEQYSSFLVAAPMPPFLSVMPDAQTGDIWLDWQAYHSVQLERATVVTGPYSPVAT